MKLLHIVTSADPAAGGTIEAVRQLGVAQQNAGHVVHVATFDAPGEIPAGDFPLPLTFLGPSKLKFRYNPNYVSWVREHAKEYDAMIVNGLWQYHAAAAPRAVAGTGVPYFIFPHGMLDPWFQRAYPLKHLKKVAFWKLFQARSATNARALLFTCEEERRLARQSFTPYEVRELIVSLGTASPTGAAEEQKAVFLAKFPELRHKRVWLFLGRIHEKKGCDLLLRAFHKITREAGGNLQEVQLVLAGPGQTDGLKALAHELGIGDRITWTGMVTGDLKWGAFRAADFFILPSHQENFGIAVVEALACGVPVLISNQVNIWREIEMDGAGLVEADTLAGTEQLMRRWNALAGPQQQAMRGQAERTFRERFEINRAAAKMIDVLAGALKS